MAGPSSEPSPDPWAHIFDAIDEVNPDAVPARRVLHGVRGRQSMTANEINAFDEMFSMIFDAVNQHQHSSSSSATTTVGEGVSPLAAIGRTGDLGDVVGKLRGRAKRARWTTAEDEQLDRLKEEMELCDTDAALLAWARRAVFHASMHASPSPLYPALLALLMRSFRDRFGDAHLALSVFEHARHLSVPSFVFGCTTPAYNELIETRWAAFRDLKGVRDALDEMRVNGVECNAKTRALVEAVRRDVGERNKWLEDSMAGGEVWTMLRQIDTLSAPAAPTPQQEKRRNRRPQKGARGEWQASDEWKYRIREDSVDPETDMLDQEWTSHTPLSEMFIESASYQPRQKAGPRRAMAY
ncbi:hypothetical protein AURDEDRAFT_114884 [Auricularia subglabra TFB-10046 SS5]|nr:hypothetical protein AURDEDRAFT_114884 [Auricularia subglabra TFB-10046 SS5]